MLETKGYWQITEFSFEVKEMFNKRYKDNETIHFNTIDKWFKEMEQKGLHYIQRAVDKKVYDELDLEIAVFIMKMRKDKWQLEPIMNLLSQRFDLRPFPETEMAMEESHIDDGRLLAEMNQQLKKLEASLIMQFEDRLNEKIKIQREELEKDLLRRLPPPKSTEELRAEKMDHFISSTRLRYKLEEEAIIEWGKLPEKERTIKVGVIFKRTEENWGKRDQFIRAYVQNKLEKME